MGRDQDRSEAGQFEWVNAWAESAKVETVFAAPSGPAATQAPLEKTTIEPAPASLPVIAPIAHMLPDDQLAHDIAEIERTRDALAAIPSGSFPAKRRTQAFTLVPSRTADTVPVVVGGVLALVMLTVFGAAAAMTKFAR